MTMPTVIEKGLSKSFLGYDILSNIKHHYKGILAGDHDEVILCSFYHAKHSDAPTDPFQIQDPLFVTQLATFKEALIDSLNSSLQQIHERQQLRDQQARDLRFKNLHKPAPQGTVGDLAKHYNVSISYVRKLKRENRLDELTRL